MGTGSEKGAGVRVESPASGAERGGRLGATDIGTTGHQVQDVEHPLEGGDHMLLSSPERREAQFGEGCLDRSDVVAPEGEVVD